ncbi:MAG TPA: hypothetical protein VK623_03540 [Flavobacterium sp.]|nr:hypothetical protein [Flavobacterium sp.]
MKKQIFLAALSGVLLFGMPMAAQDKAAKDKTKAKDKTAVAATAPADKQYIVTVTTLHWNMNLKDFSMDAWKAVEKEYYDKVTKKNDLIVGQEVLTHYFTADNTELLLVTMYDSWDAIEKAGAKDDELVKAAWPDEKARNAYFDKREAYYAPNHSDEIYRTYWGEKLAKAPFTKPMLFYVRKSHWAWPKDGTEKEFKELRGKYLDAVVFKNDFIKAYYPNVHAWGANNTEFTEVFVAESLGDIEKGFDRNKELFEATWTDEAKRKEFDDKYDKYFTGVHGDYIYRSVPELTK